MFVNRVKELQLLNDEYKEEGFRFSVLYGRRRVGKTTLLKEYIQNKESIYFLVTLESENIVLKRFQDIIANYLNDDFLKELKIDSFEQIFKYISQKTFEKKLIIIIDEFQYLTKINSSIPSIFPDFITFEKEHKTISNKPHG